MGENLDGLIFFSKGTGLLVGENNYVDPCL